MGQDCSIGLNDIGLGDYCGSNNPQIQAGRTPAGKRPLPRDARVTVGETNLSKFHSYLMKKYEVQRPYFSCQPGEVEAFMFRLRDGISFNDEDAQILLINVMNASLDNRFDAVRIQSMMDAILSLDEPTPLLRSIYVRPSG